MAFSRFNTDQTQHWELHRAVNPAPFGASRFDSYLIHQEMQMIKKPSGSAYFYTGS